MIWPELMQIAILIVDNTIDIVEYVREIIEESMEGIH